MPDVGRTRIEYAESLAGDLEFSYYEYKYLVRHRYLSHVHDLLNEFYGHSDPFPEGIVDSVYYDTYEDSCLDQCLNGDSKKWKFRVRGYGDDTFNQVHQKVKDLSSVAKYKSYIRPAKASHDYAPCWDDLVPVDPNDLRFAKIMYNARRTGSLVPSVRIKYHRYRYRIYDYRITLDTNIEAIAPINGLPRSQTYARLPYHVLEIKSRDLRPVLPFVGLAQLPQVSFSKFMIGLGLLNE